MQSIHAIFCILAIMFFLSAGYQPPAAASPWRVEFSRKGEPRRGGGGGGGPGGGRGGYSDRGPPPVRGEAKYAFGSCRLRYTPEPDGAVHLIQAKLIFLPHSLLRHLVCVAGAISVEK